MILFRAQTKEQALSVVEDFENVYDFSHLDLAELNTLELNELAPESDAWTSGEPLIFDEESGLLIIAFSEESINWLKNNVAALAEFGIDQSDVIDFTQTTGGVLYCMDTF